MNTPVALLLVGIALLGMPLFIVLGGAAAIHGALAGDEPAVLIVEIYRMASSPNLMAIPLFTLAGVVLAHGGAPQRLVRVFNALFGWAPGGLAMVAIMACAFFTAFSGASGITILALGGLLYPMLRAEAYPRQFSLGLLTTSGSLGLLFPPSLAILLYGVVAQVSIEDLFKAGLVPGLLLMVMLGIYSWFRASASGVQRTPLAFDQVGPALRQGMWDLALPPVIVIGVLTGSVTVSEAAALTACWVLILECLILKNLNTRKLYAALIETCILTGSILIIVALAMALTNAMVDSQLPMRMLAVLQEHISDPLWFLILLNILLLVAGCVMDIFSAIVILTPLILPIAQQYNIDPVHLGIIFLANLEIGYSTPPVGINLFIASQRFGKPVLTLIRSTLPFLLIMLVWLMAVTWIPELSLWWR